MARSPTQRHKFDKGEYSHFRISRMQKSITPYEKAHVLQRGHQSASASGKTEIVLFL